MTFFYLLVVVAVVSFFGDFDLVFQEYRQPVRAVLGNIVVPKTQQEKSTAR